MNERERFTAFHEAGHAVVAIRLGLAVKRLSIVEDENSLGRAEHNEIGDWFRPDIEVNARVSNRIRDEIIAAWAGTLAEERAGASAAELEAGAAFDVDKIVFLSEYVTGSTEESEAYVEWLRRRTENMLKRWDVWPCIEAVADALLAVHTLSGPRVREVMRTALALPPVELIR